MHKKYCLNPYKRERFHTREVQVGTCAIGGSNPIVVQSMTTTDTMDTKASVEQAIRMINAGCELVRLTAPSKKEAENLRRIKNELVSAGYNTPLVADIHFTPNAAEIAAEIVEKVRVNPGNYADKKKFEHIDYTEEAYQEELKRIEEKFVPLVALCKKNGTAMRIGTNHGSLSDRILSKFGDTPEGMVESAMEFVRICQKYDFHDIVFSMKASNTLVMVEAYRLLVATMMEQGMNYPLHLGVTEAGDGEDGRIKSAVGIGALLEDGIGDTIRVSLTEEPEAEIPVAVKLLEKFKPENYREYDLSVNNDLPYDPFHFQRRESIEIMNIGHKHVPVVVGDLSAVAEIKPSHLFPFGYHYSVPLDKWHITDTAADYIYIGENTIDFELPGTVGVIVDLRSYLQYGLSKREGFYPLIQNREDLTLVNRNDVIFIEHPAEDAEVSYLQNYPNAVVILKTDYSNKTQLFRYSYLNFAINNINSPIILHDEVRTNDPETFQLWCSSNLGSAFLDGYADGLMLSGDIPTQIINTTSFGILQATRSRISKTEYISCPSCGRTLFNLQTTTAKIREKTSHLKGIKIGIMGCIVNGPGEMADADYGYVGTGPGKIHLYKEKIVVRKNVPEEEAVEQLIELIKSHGDWIEP